MADFLGKLGKAKCFSSIDPATAYYYIRVAKVTRIRWHFFTNEGIYEYVVMLFELHNATSTSQRLINLFYGFIHGFATIYLDSILVFSKNY